MGNRHFAGLTALFLFAVCVGPAAAGDVSTRKMMLKDSQTDPDKRQIQLQSKDPGIAYSDASGFGTYVHLYSSSIDFCILVGGSSPRWQDTGKVIKYNAGSVKVRISNGNLLVKFRGNTEIDLTTTPLDTVNAEVRFGQTGERFCMKCTMPDKDTELLYQASNCEAAACDVPAMPCVIGTTTTTATLPDTPADPGVVAE